MFPRIQFLLDAAYKEKDWILILRDNWSGQNVGASIVKTRTIDKYDTYKEGGRIDLSRVTHFWRDGTDPGTRSARYTSEINAIIPDRYVKIVVQLANSLGGFRSPKHKARSKSPRMYLRAQGTPTDGYTKWAQGYTKRHRPEYFLHKSASLSSEISQLTSATMCDELCHKHIDTIQGHARHFQLEDFLCYIISLSTQIYIISFLVLICIRVDRWQIDSGAHHRNFAPVTIVS